MEEYNIFVIIVIIILLFFLSADKSITNDTIDTIPLLLVLVIFYFCINNISLGLLLIVILFLVLSTTNIKQILMERIYHHTQNEDFTSKVENALSIFDKNYLSTLINNKRTEKLEQKKEKKKEYDDKVDKEHIKNKNMLVNDDEHDNVNYSEFKKQMNMFDGVDEKLSKSEVEQEEIKTSIQEKKHTDINDLMNKLDTDMNNIKT
tara:strand:- start:933 stop:1547 length:615 start_codon:yes stop_codon:yes gene_type:complete